MWRQAQAARCRHFLRRQINGTISIMAFSGAFVKPFRPAFDAGLAAAAVPWYLAGGAPAPIAVYQPKGAASLAASYVNLANPGTYDAAPGVAPTHDAAAGWTLNGSTQYLSTGILPVNNQTWSILARVSGAGNSPYGYVLNTATSDSSLYLYPAYSDNKAYYSSGSYIGVSPNITSGTMAVAANTAYRNGVSDGTIASGGAAFTTTLLIGKVSNSPSGFFKGNIQAIAIWDTSTGHATWMPQVMAACALI